MGKEFYVFKASSSKKNSNPSCCWFILTLCTFTAATFLGCTPAKEPRSKFPPSPPLTKKEKGHLTKKKPKDAPILYRAKPKLPSPKKKKHWVQVLKVIDGVTFSLDDLHLIRLIGVARPKSFGDKKYKEFFEKVTTPAVRQIVEGERVFLMRDKVIKGRDGKLVLYLFLKDNTLLNAILIKKGYARLSQEVPFKFQDEFRLWERDAKKIGLGYWGLDDD